ncbi:MAG TPA: cysteine desulfurase family protein [Xanthobacteraceae bacterium]|jgi:cysteine desulfurase
MTAERTYLDHNATSPLRPPARAALQEALALGNASSVHAEGRAARAAVEHAREQVAALVAADPRGVTFTSGATEANVLALSPEFQLDGRMSRCDVLLVSGVEHPSVRAGGRFMGDQIEVVPVDRDGIVDLAALDASLVHHRDQGRRALVSVMTANNETGVLQPVTEIAARVHAADGIFHSDAVQVAGKLPFSLVDAGADLISISSHKFGGPQGTGALIARNDDFRAPPLVKGGGQERGRRAGTENVAAIVGFGVAAQLASAGAAGEERRLTELRNAAEAGLRAIAPEAVVLSAGATRLPNTLCFAVPGVAAETAVIAFDLEGVAVSAGAACSSGKVGPSETLAAMHVASEIAKGAIRVSLGWSTTESDISRFLEVWKRVYLNVSQRRRERAA